MTLIMCSVRDAKSETFGRPFFAVAAGVALRSFEDEVNNAQDGNMLYAHPGDFALYKLGTFDDVTATIETHVPQLLVMGDQVKKTTPKEK